MINKKIVRLVIACTGLLTGCETLGEPDRIPVADAGSDTTCFFTDTIYLDGSLSACEKGKSLLYIWEPSNSLPFAKIIDSLPIHRFFGLPKGNHTFTLTVFDGTNYSKPDQVTIKIKGADIIVTQNPTHFSGFHCYAKLSYALVDARPGDTIYLDDGTYEDSVVIKTNDLFIYGSSSETVIINGKNYSSAPVTFDDASTGTLRDVGINGGAEEADCGGIVIRNSENIRISNCTILKNQTDGLHIINSGASAEIQIDSCVIAENKYNGIWCVGSSITITKCVFQKNAKTKTDTSRHTATIFISDPSPSNIVLESNMFSKSNDPQIWSTGPSEIVARSNSFDSVFMGFYLPSQCSATVEMSNNNFSYIDRHCVWCQGQSRVNLVTSSDTMNSQWTPIWCSGAKNISVIGNSIICKNTGWRDINQKGIDLGGCDSGMISGNRIEGFLIGIILNQSPVILSDNVFIGDSICLCNFMSADKSPLIQDDNDWSGCVIDTSSDCLPEQGG